MKSSVIFNTIAMCVTIFFIFAGIMGFFIPTIKPIGYNFESQLKEWAGMWATMIVIANALFLPAYVYNFIAWINRKVSKKFEDSETFIYTRDVPEYNAAIAGLLYDFKTDYEQEFIACVLDLIAKGYIVENAEGLSLNVSKVNQAYSENKFLKSEVYILDLCWKNVSRIKSAVTIDFSEELEEDLKKLGFGRTQRKLEKIKKYFRLQDTENTSEFLDKIIFSFMLVFILFLWGLVYCFEVTICIFAILCGCIIFWLRNSKLTKVGEKEKEKITKLNHFLEQQTAFSEKENNEKEMWDRYPAFAVALGVNKEIPKEILKKLNIKD